jgi:hypothetical protein
METFDAELSSVTEREDNCVANVEVSAPSVFEPNRTVLAVILPSVIVVWKMFVQMNGTIDDCRKFFGGRSFQRNSKHSSIPSSQGMRIRRRR